MGKRISRIIIGAIQVGAIALGCSTAVHAANECIDAFSASPAQELDWVFYFPMEVRSSTGKSFRLYCSNYCFSAPQIGRGGDYSALVRNGRLFTKTEDLLKFIYSTYSSRETLPPDMIAKFKRLDSELEPEHSVFLVSPDRESGKPRVAMRIYDASPRTSFIQTTATRLPMEREFPSLILPDRAAGNEYLIELGRLGKSKDLTGDPRLLLKSIAEYLKRSHFPHGPRGDGVDPVIYVESSSIGLRLYKRFGFTKVFGPEEVGAADTYISRVKASEFVKLFESTE